MNNSDKIRVRFAPSPTGHLHLGGARGAIFNWLFARHHGGKFLIRIEDTDSERSQEVYTRSILASLDWLGMQSDEPVVIQSEQFQQHQDEIDRLLAEGKAYRCYCAYKKDEQEREAGTLYGGACWSLRQEQPDGRPFVIRFRLPDALDATLSFHDLIHGMVRIAAKQLDDFIIVRSDGVPVYNFAAVVDDATMGITHVIRGDDHISNTFKQLLLYQALGYRLPQFAHLPLVLNKDGSKLSKRDMVVALPFYRQEGYLADALFNYLVRLGWGYRDQEIFNRQELIEKFTLSDVGSSGSVFDQEKLNWLNGVYIREQTAEELLRLITQAVCPDFVAQVSLFTRAQLVALLDLYKNRAATLKELVAAIVNLHASPVAYDTEELEKWEVRKNCSLFRKLVNRLMDLEQWDVNSLSLIVKSLSKETQLKLGFLAQPLRIALTGHTSSPGIFELLAILGKEESGKRFHRLLAAVAD